MSQVCDSAAALELFDRVVEQPEPDLRGLCNALYAVQNDNTGVGLMPERARRYLECAEPFGPQNPEILHNGACVLAELGDTQCLHWIEAALRHGFEAPYQLDSRGRILSFEDAYCPEVFEQFAKAVVLPDVFTRTLGQLEKTSAAAVAGGYVEAVRALEEAFEQAGTPLRTLWTGGGDTVHFIATTPAVAQTWTGRAVVHQEDGAPLGSCMPARDTFFEHLGHALGWPRELEVPQGFSARVWREG